jgi:hypothetical protein
MSTRISGTGQVFFFIFHFFIGPSNNMSESTQDGFSEAYAEIQNIVAEGQHYFNLNETQGNFTTKRYPTSVETQLKELGFRVNRRNIQYMLHMREYTFGELPTSVLVNMIGQKGGPSDDDLPEDEKRRFTLIRSIYRIGQCIGRA